jgi:hypothetical protein
MCNYFTIKTQIFQLYDRHFVHSEQVRTMRKMIFALAAPGRDTKTDARESEQFITLGMLMATY